MSRGVAFAALGNHALSATSSPSAVNGSITGAGTCTSGAASAVPVGGGATFTYSWAAPGFTADTPTAATSTFSKSLADGGTFSGTATCTVTDKQSGQTATTTVSVGLSSNTGHTWAADISPGSVWRNAGIGAGPFTDSFTVSVSNGSGSYTYAWSVINGLGATIVGSSTGASCSFRYNMGPDMDQFWGTSIGCHVVDATLSESGDPGASIIQTPR